MRWIARACAGRAHRGRGERSQDGHAESATMPVDSMAPRRLILHLPSGTDWLQTFMADLAAWGAAASAMRVEVGGDSGH